MSKNETSALQGAGSVKAATCGAVSECTAKVNNIVDRLREVDQHMMDNLTRLGAFNPTPASTDGEKADRPGELGDLHQALERLHTVVESLESYRSDINGI